VIWMLGICMMLLAAAVHLPTLAVAAIGIAIVALHNLTDLFAPKAGNALLKILYFGGEVNVAGAPLLILYVIVPWIGVMMAGYAFGRVMELPPDRRRSLCLRLGLALTLAFVLLRALGVYGDPRPWTAGPPRMPPALRFLATTKYPASLAFLLMTLGPMLFLLGLAERWRGRLAQAVAVFGKVPLFYYLLHIPLIHLAACLVSLVREGRVDPWLFGNHPLAPPPVPHGYTWSLPLLYLVFALCVLALYLPCRWYARERARRRARWLSYL
jgi:uncharacterized membrane protein